MIDIDKLKQIDERFRPIVMRATPEELAARRASWLAGGLKVKTIDGSRTRTTPELFEEFRVVLEFPAYCGRNWDAFNDCITDLSWLDVSAGLVFLVTQADELLCEADAGDLSRLANVLISAAEYWSRPVEEGEWWDRPALPFQFVLSGGVDKVGAVIQRWAEAGLLPAEN